MILCSLMLTVTLTLLVTSDTEQVEVMSGILTEILTLPTMYHTFVPIILEYKLPTYSKDNLSTVSWMDHDQCKSSEYKSNTSCPTSFYLPTEVNNFFSFLEQINPRDSQISNEILGGEENLDDHNKIVAPMMKWQNLEESIKMFEHTRTVTKDVAEEYLTSTIKNPQVTVYYMSRKIEYFSSNSQMDNIRNMLNSFSTTYSQHINSDRIGEAVLSNAMSLYQSMVFQRYFMESFRWSRAESQCREENIIPKTIVSKGKIANALRNLAMQLKNYSYTLAIPEDHLQRYFTEKLASCVFTQDDSFIVTIQVPLRHSPKVEEDRSLRLVKVHSVPFMAPLRPSQVCQIKIEDSARFYLQDMTTGAIRVSRCKSRELCGVPQPSEFLESSLNNPCISLLLSSSLSSSELSKKSVEKYCPLTCLENQHPPSEFPWVTKISSDVVILTGISATKNNTYNFSRSAVLHCPEEPDQLIATFSVGAAFVRVPNKCKIVFLWQKNSKLASYPQTQVTQQGIPIHWIENGVLGRYSINSLKITGSSDAVDANNDGSTSPVKSKQEICKSECSNQIGVSHDGIVVTGIFVVATCLVTCFIYLFLEIRKLKGQLVYRTEDYKEFVAYKNGTVRTNLLESY